VARIAGQRPRLSEILYADILREINSGRFSVGDRLPSEADMALQFSVSRPIVREALGRLREDGVVHSRKGSGSFVSGPSTPETKPVEGSGRTIASIADVQKLFQFREAVEGEIAFFAASTRTDEQLEAIEKAAEDLALSHGKSSDGTAEDVRFHRAIAVASNNPFFIDTLDRIAPDMKLIVELARALLMRQPLRNIETVQAEHSVIVDAIKDGDGKAARERMQFHIRTAQTRLFFGEGRNGAALW
jgi:GntR family transcriptional regulator, transcriptional repressor for pyruvate dehydrogenase complex